jgi:hypothetical protein
MGEQGRRKVPPPFPGPPDPYQIPISRLPNADPGFLRLPQQVAPIDDELPSHSPDLTHLLELAIIVMNEHSII